MTANVRLSGLHAQQVLPERLEHTAPAGDFAGRSFSALTKLVDDLPLAAHGCSWREGAGASGTPEKPPLHYP
jgi:hypothetical protein